LLALSDKNNITKGIALTYFKKDGRKDDTLAGRNITQMGIEVTPRYC
jgi:hypothetical protein